VGQCPTWWSPCRI